MQIIGTVVSVNLNTTAETQAGKSYPAWKLIYEDNSGKVNSIVKHVNGLKYNKALSNGLVDLAPGDKFTLEQDKNDQGFWEPKNIFKGAKEQSTTQQGTPIINKPQTSTTGSWTTAEERAQTQVHIIRQNCVTNAVNFVNSTFAKKDQTVVNVLSVAKQFENFIHTGDTGTIMEMTSDNLDSGIE
jgi:murein tripeptide amidase MpaA